MRTFKEHYFKLMKYVAKGLELLLTILMITLLVSVALQIIGRYVPFIPRFLWTLEVSNFSLIWAILIGAMLATKERTHFFVDLIPESMEEKFGLFIEIIYFTAMFTAALVFIIYGIPFLRSGLAQKSQFTGLNLGFIHVSVPVAGVVWIMFLIEQLLHKHGE